MINFLKKRLLIVTHSGKFQADEVFACAAISMMHHGRVRILRSRREEDFAKGDYVVDVGLEYDPARKRFDHHQEGGAGTHPEGIPYSSFGLVWKEYGEKIAGTPEVAEKVRTRLALPIDANDTGTQTFDLRDTRVPLYGISDAIRAFRTSFGEIKNYNYNPGFFKAYAFAKEILTGEIERAKSEVRARAVVDEAYARAEDKRILVLSEKASWSDRAAELSDVLFVITPPQVVTNDPPSTYWYVKTVKKEENSFEDRARFPEAWAGKEGEELQRVSGVPDAVFCHNRGFIASARSREGALSLAQKALN